MFCAKCGKELLDDAGFCAYCGNPVANISNQDISSANQYNFVAQQTQNKPLVNDSQPIYSVQQPVYYIPTASILKQRDTDAPILEHRERGFIIASGLICIIIGVIRFIVGMVLVNNIPSSISFFSLISSDVRNSITLIVVLFTLVLLIDTFFGVMILLKMRWALLTVRVFMILGIVINGITLICNIVVGLDQFDKFGIYVYLFFMLFVIGCYVMMLVFVNIGAGALSKETQLYRKEIIGNNQVFMFEKYDSNVWECKQCGAYNSIGNSFCKDCGSYK